MTFQKIQKIIFALTISSFLFFWIGSGILVFASGKLAQNQKKKELERIASEWEQFYQQIEEKYSSRIERNKQRLFELRLELEKGLQRFDQKKQDTEAQERALRILQSQLGTLRGQLENLAFLLGEAEQKVKSIEEQIVTKETRLIKVLEEKEVIAAEADIQRNIVTDYFTLLQTESESFLPENSANGLRIIFSADSFTKNLRDEMHFTALEKSARQIFHDLEGAMSQLQEADLLLTRERHELKQLHSNLEVERRTLALQRAAQKEIFETTLGEERRFEALLRRSQKEMEESALAIAEQKVDIDYIREQLNIFEGQKKIEKRKLNEKKAEHALKPDPETVYEIGKKFLQEDRAKSPLAWPVAPEKITAYFKDASYQKTFGVIHNALDIRARHGSEISAPAAGYVYKVVDNGVGYSWLALIHANNLMTVYGHISRFEVAEGDLVQLGDVIALSGGTIGTRGAGTLTTGPHLHFEVWENGKVKNPLDYLPLEELQPEDVPKQYLFSELKEEGQ